jgi:preprotein translocase subunit SecF
LEENKEQNTEINKQPEVSITDNQGHEEKLEVYEEKQEPIQEQEIIQPKEETPRVEETPIEKTEIKEEPKQEPKSQKSEISDRLETKSQSEITETVPVEKETYREPKEPLLKRLKNFYDKQYKKLMIFPILLLVISILLIGIQTATTGTFINKDVSLKGGVTLTITKDIQVDIAQLEQSIQSQFTNNDISVRSIKTGDLEGAVIISDMDGTDKEQLDSFISSIQSSIGSELTEKDYSIEVMGSSLGASFFKETLKAIYISFLFMGIVVFWYFGQDIKFKIIGTVLSIIAGFLMFSGSASIVKDGVAYAIGLLLILIYLKSSIPSFMVIFNVFSDIIVTLAIVNIIGIKISTAGIAAFLMIIGYSVDTNILLSTKLIKSKKGELMDRLFGAMKTGLTMSLTTSAAVIVALIFQQSGVMGQIMTILLIGLIVDMIYTWIQNAGILRFYIERKDRQNE